MHDIIKSLQLESLYIKNGNIFRVFQDSYEIIYLMRSEDDHQQIHLSFGHCRYYLNQNQNGNIICVSGSFFCMFDSIDGFISFRDLLRDLRRISNIKPTVSAADWLPEQRNPLPRQDKTSLTNFTQLYTTDMPNLKYPFILSKFLVFLV